VHRYYCSQSVTVFNSRFLVRAPNNGYSSASGLKNSPNGGSLPIELFLSESESYVTTDGQAASLSWNKAPIWRLRPDLDYCRTVAGLLMWGVLSDERRGLSFAIATGPRQRSHSRVCVFVAAGMCLPSPCLEEVLVDLLFSWSLYTDGSARYI
jgi:hypothetical protein